MSYMKMIQLLFSMYKVSFMAGFSLHNNSRNNTKKIRLVEVDGCSITEKKIAIFMHVWDLFTIKVKWLFKK